MTSLIEKTVALIAPHRCIICGIYNNIVCNNCLGTLPKIAQPICLLCGDQTASWQPCVLCRPMADLTHLWAYGIYDATLGAAIKEYKFNFVREAAKPLATLLHRQVPALKGWCVTYVPTAAPRIRWRGYDHAEQLAREFAKLHQLPFAGQLLVRSHNNRQVGATRAERQKQAEVLFTAPKPLIVKDKKILIIDDVCTTGATLKAAAKALRATGASQVAAATAAYQPPQQK